MEDLNPEKLHEILAKISGPEGFKKLIVDTENQIKRYEVKIETTKKQILSLEKVINEHHGGLQALKKMLEILNFLHGKWGLNEITLAHSMEIVKDSSGFPIDRIVEEDVVQIDPETKARQDEAKFCMWKDKETKKWCQRKRVSKTGKESDYCALHHKIAYGEE